MRSLQLLSLSLVLCLLCVSPALAHKVNLFAYVEGGVIYTESYFPDGKKVKQGRIEIFDNQDQLLVAGATDDSGRYQIAIPEVEDLKIVISASMGHRNSFILKKAEIEAGK
ncbi:hypothetical protein [Geopsychrobacter electrodiphilus]|uniref:hypothetical protein n=1 Tax=Geopsychrobacter electrodiphilus TaxID=225196 RepID=UPI00036D395C|nr:hypothetical protein [Geopsychrobacter electrodiphilus]